MNPFLMNPQIEELSLIDISSGIMEDEHLAALLEVTVDELLGLTWTDDIPDPVTV